MLCETLSSIKGVQAFIRCFQLRSSAGTVMNKAHHLLRLSRYADGFFTQRGMSEKQGILRCVIEYLHGVARSHKNESRRLATIRKQEELRNETNRYLTPQDMEHFAGDCLDNLADIINSSEALFRDKGHDGLVEYLQKNRGIMRKWNLNFLCAMALQCGGQRPQVYAIVEKPCTVDFVTLQRQAKETAAFALKTTYEKRVRSAELPNVLIPSAMYHAVRNHAGYVLPALYNRHRIPSDDPRRNCLFLHTESGEVLATRQITERDYRE